MRRAADSADARRPDWQAVGEDYPEVAASAPGQGRAASAMSGLSPPRQVDELPAGGSRGLSIHSTVFT
jgi:hypothetical protein